MTSDYGNSMAFKVYRFLQFFLNLGSILKCEIARSIDLDHMNLVSSKYYPRRRHFSLRQAKRHMGFEVVRYNPEDTTIDYRMLKVGSTFTFRTTLRLNRKGWATCVIRYGFMGSEPEPIQIRVRRVHI